MLGGIELEHQDLIGEGGGGRGRSGLAGCWLARARTEREYGHPASASTPSYVAAALGQTPYVAVGNGAIVVQRRGCTNWNC